MGYLNKTSLNQYGQYFFSNKNKNIINNEIQNVVFRYTEVRIGNQNLDMINDYMVQIYQVFGNFEYDTNKQNEKLVEIITNKVIKACSENIIQNLTMQRKLQKRRDRVTFKKKMPLPQLQDKKSPLILNSSMPIDDSSFVINNKS
jgi:hypothetical protein